jgi:hypothetical protein
MGMYFATCRFVPVHPRNHLLFQVGSSSVFGKAGHPFFHRISGVYRDRSIQTGSKYIIWCIYSMGRFWISWAVWNCESPVRAHGHAGCTPLHVMHTDTSSARVLYILVLFYVSNMPGSPIIRRMLCVAD